MCALSCFASGVAAATAQGGPDADVAVVEVTGERPGPNLWRVSNGEHVVWLLGTLDPLPKGITWQSKEIESVLGEVKQLVPSRPDVDVSAGPITLVRTYFQWRRVKKIPGNETLKDWLPPELYTRWNALKARYKVSDNDIDKLTPLLAATRLYARALDISKLSSGDGIERSVVKLARKHNVQVTQTELKVKDPREVVTQFGEIPRNVQVSCLEAIVEHLEKDMETVKAQANAWALGDVAALRALPYPKEIEVCTNALETSDRMKGLIEGVDAGWNNSVDAALSGRGKPTLAVKPIYELLGANGTIEKLRARGFRIEGP
ncbi:MAG TPA: TraB/GumN family protein [Steroidobacteraceae bacterium]|nr:TraB/GumN family protein [Steroidobacteraceae bacterium]